MSKPLRCERQCFIFDSEYERLRATLSQQDWFEEGKFDVALTIPMSRFITHFDYTVLRAQLVEREEDALPSVYVPLLSSFYTYLEATGRIKQAVEERFPTLRSLLLISTTSGDTRIESYNEHVPEILTTAHLINALGLRERRNALHLSHDD